MLPYDYKIMSVYERARESIAFDAWLFTRYDCRVCIKKLLKIINKKVCMRD